jgi:hypothetical protein
LAGIDGGGALRDRFAVDLPLAGGTVPPAETGGPADTVTKVVGPGLASLVQPASTINAAEPSARIRAALATITKRR